MKWEHYIKIKRDKNLKKIHPIQRGGYQNGTGLPADTLEDRSQWREVSGGMPVKI
jgi:hypothetical protein